MPKNTLSYQEPPFWKIWWQRYTQWLRRNEPSYTEQYALRELRAAGYPPPEEIEEGPNKWIQENILELIRVFAKQGHSGLSAPYCIAMFEKLALHKPLGPLTGAPEEWTVLDYDDDMKAQNKRCTHVFRRKDGSAYDSQGRVFREPNGSCYTNAKSRVEITFPYTPKIEYVDVPA